MKDLHHLKIPSLPTDAGAYRQWKNSLRTNVMAYDRSTDGAVMGCLSKALAAKSEAERAELKSSSVTFRVLTASWLRRFVVQSTSGLLLGFVSTRTWMNVNWGVVK